MGDFNLKIAKKKGGTRRKKKCIKKFGLENRNSSGGMPVHFPESQLQAVIIFSQKKITGKWIRIILNEEVKNEVNQIFYNINKFTTTD